MYKRQTLGSVLAAGLLLLLVGFMAHNLPGVLELVVLRRLTVEPGNRNAIITITRYLIVGTGLAVALNIIGVSWSSVQWLVAALGVGLGFGLQEIFANFVSGLILLLAVSYTHLDVYKRQANGGFGQPGKAGRGQRHAARSG